MPAAPASSLRDDPFFAFGLYLWVIAPPLLFGPPSFTHVALSLAHLAVAGAVVALARGPYHPGSGGLVVLLVLLPLSYGEIAWLNQLMASGYHDELINAVESAVF